MPTSENDCGECNKFIPARIRIIKCDTCNKFFHVKCCGINHKTFHSIKQSNDWHCKTCAKNVSDTATHESIKFKANNVKPAKKVKCGKCHKHIPVHLRVINCDSCKTFLHVKCSGTNQKSFLDKKLKNENWLCFTCTTNVLPFSHIDNNELFLELENKTKLLNSTPSFTIQSLLDEMPGQNFETDEFMGETITSKYFTPAELLQAKLPKNKFSMLHINIASLGAHIDELRNLLQALDHPFDIIGISETRLYDKEPLVNINIDGYNFKHTPTTTQCGGAGVYIKNIYDDFDIRDDLSGSITNITESIFIELKRNGKKNVIIGCIYRHHTPISTFIEGYFKKTLDKLIKQPNKICALMGDFNVDLLKYASDTNVGDFYDLLSSYSFRPLILQPTRVTSKTATLIDNIFINDISCQSFGGNLTSSISDHYFQFAQTDIFETFKPVKKTKFSRDFRKLNKREFEEELSNVDWSGINENSGTDASYLYFYKKIEEILDLLAPYRKMTQKEIKLEQMPWITRGVLISMGIRDNYYKRLKVEKDPDIKTQFTVLYKRYRNMILQLLRQSKKNYYASYFLRNQSNAKKTWDGIRNLINVSKKKSSSPTKLIYKNEEKVSNVDMAEALNDFFVNIGSSIETKIPKPKQNFSSYLKNPNNKSIFLSPCTPNEISSIIIKDMNPSKSSGPNSISTNLLIEFSELVVNPLSRIINMSLTEGVFPSLNKEANVCPIHKKNEKTKCDNYRPISLLPNISKIFERVIYTRLDNFLTSSEIIYKLQFGFRKQYSTNHALLGIVEQIRNALDKKMFTCGVFIDLEKAFDTVNHQILLAKLEHYGIRGVANKWLSSYLSDRYQKVSLNGIYSSKLPITCGVPQGSILGPLLFLIYINDMHTAMEFSTIYHFADDTNLLYSCKSPNVLRKRLNKDLALLYDWLCANRLSLNAGKTEFIVFRPSNHKTSERITLKLHHSKLFESSKIKYLGLILDNKLNWKAHVSELSKKLSRAVGLLYKIRRFCTVSVLRSLYFSIFNSHLSYGLAVWGNASRSYINKIKVLQRRALKAIAFSHKDNHINTSDIHHNLKILNIDHQIQVQLSSLMWDYDHNTLPASLNALFKKSNLVHNYSTRGASKGKLHYSKVNTNKHGIKSFKYQGIKILNDLKDMPIYQNSVKKSVFLKELKQDLLSTYVS